MDFFINGVFLTAVAVFARAVALIFNAYVGGRVGAQGMGLYTMVNTVFGFAMTFATAGISLTVTGLVASAVGEGREGDIGRILSASALYAAAFGTVATVVLWALAPSLAVGVLKDGSLSAALRLLSLSLLPQALGSVFFGYFVGVRRVIGNALTQVLAQGVRIVLTVVLITRISKGAAAMACLYLSAISLAVELLAFVLQFVRFLIDRINENGKKANKTLPLTMCMRSVAGMALPLGLSAYIRSALVTVEHALIPLCLQLRGEGVAQSFASYGILHAMTLPVLLFPMATLSSFASLLVPEYAEASAAGKKERLSRITSRAVHTTLVYATVTAVMVAVFSEEIGYCLYGSYEVGYYLARMAPVLPLMYLDHVTDCMLKGIGEQVYSMWVNISDACLSVILVRLLIPVMGIGGYALVIVCMEGYNFLLSFLRLRKRIAFSFRPVRYVVFPLLFACGAAILTKTLFRFSGASAPPLWLCGQILFAVCMSIGALYITQSIEELICRGKRIRCVGDDGKHSL